MELKPIFPIHSQSNPIGFCTYYDSFSEEELGWINNLQKLYTIEKASTGDYENEDIIRKSDIKWLEYEKKTDWLYSRLSNIAMLLFFKFVNNSVKEGTIDLLQIEKYRKEEGTDKDEKFQRYKEYIKYCQFENIIENGKFKVLRIVDSNYNYNNVGSTLFKDSNGDIMTYGCVSGSGSKTCTVNGKNPGTYTMNVEYYPNGQLNSTKIDLVSQPFTQ
jgi:hypothetical protein